MITKRRTTHGHLVAWFNAPRDPLTPMGPPQARQNHRQNIVANRTHWQSQTRWQPLGWGAGGVRGRRLRSRPCRPKQRRFSDRAQSLRLLPQPFAPTTHFLDQYGSFAMISTPTVGSVYGGVAEDVLLCGADPTCQTLPTWLNAYGSNDELYVPASPAAAMHPLSPAASKEPQQSALAAVEGKLSCDAASPDFVR